MNGFHTYNIEREKRKLRYDCQPDNELHCIPDSKKLSEVTISDMLYIS